MQEEERQHKDKSESAHLSLTSQNKKRKKTQDDVEGSSHQKK